MAADGGILLTNTKQLEVGDVLGFTFPQYDKEIAWHKDHVGEIYNSIVGWKVLLNGQPYNFEPLKEGHYTVEVWAKEASYQEYGHPVYGKPIYGYIGYTVMQIYVTSLYEYQDPYLETPSYPDVPGDPGSSTDNGKESIALIVIVVLAAAFVIWGGKIK